MIHDKTNCSFESIQHTESTNLNIFRKIEVFEKKNDISVMVLALKGPEVYIARKLECKASKDVQLLLITNGE